MNLKHWLQKYFVPQEKNDHRPYFLRVESALSILTAILFIETVFMVQPAFFQKTDLFASILQNVLVSETNNSRRLEDVSVLKESPLLDAAAQMKAEDMASKGYFAHNSPQGITPWYWMNQTGYEYTYAGENLAINFSDSEDVVRAWLNSPAHRNNLLSKHFTEIGIATAKGVYDGRETIFIVQMFGTPVRSRTIVSAPPKAAELLPAKPPFPAAVTSSETLASVKGIETSSVPEADIQIQIIGKNSPASIFVWKMTTSPKTASIYVYAFIIFLIFVALLLNIAIRPKIQHPKLLLNGAILLLVINAIIILNDYISLLNAKIL